MKAAIKNKKSFFYGIVFAVLAISFFFLIPSNVFAQTQIVISSNLPGVNATSTGPGGFVANFYQFALWIAGLLAFAVIIYGGVKYMASGGNPSAQSDAKEWIEAALIGLLLLVGAYFILKVINPQLLNLNAGSLTPVNITVSSGGGGGTGGGGGGSGTTGNPGNSCAPPANGPCANASNLSCFGSSAQFMQGVCNRESGGNAALPSAVDKGADGNPVSFGLFQINISANNMINPATGQSVNCPSAFSGGQYTAHNHNTRVSNSTLYNQCVKLAEDPTANIQTACAMSNGGKNLGPWTSTNGTCGI